MSSSSDKAPLPSIRPLALRVNVVELLRDALIRGHFQPGEDLIDSALAKSFGVSRGPVREALLLLVEEGLVEHPHYRGFRVPSFTREDIHQITRARYPLEVIALRLARDRATPEAIEELKQLKTALLEAKKSGKAGATAQPDYHFHQYVWNLSGDRWLLAALRRLCSSHFLYLSIFDLGLRRPPPETLDQQHQLMIDYISGTTSQTAEECMTFHLKNSSPPESK